MSDQLTAEQITQRLEGVSIPDVARGTGLAYNTIKNLKMGKKMNTSTLRLLSIYFKEQG